MTQFVFIVRDPLNSDPVAEPFDINLYTTDQAVVWKNLVPDTQWSTQRPVPIVFEDAWFTAGGSTPVPLTAPNGAPLWTANGPGPVTAAVLFTYQVYLEPSGGGQAEIRVSKIAGDQILVDPDVWNQPQP